MLVIRSSKQPDRIAFGLSNLKKPAARANTTNSEAHAGQSR